MSYNPTIGISFSGGGTRATAHVGIIQAFNENGIQATHAAGTSGGAIMGALYAAGVSTEKMMDFVAKGKLSKLFTPAFPSRGLGNLKFLQQLLDQYIDKDTFEELDIPLTVVASNLMTGKPVHFISGSLYPAVMASCAVPLMFKPIEINGQLYADGGIFDNMPVTPLQGHCDIIIGINLIPITPLAKKDLQSVFSISMRAFDMIVAHNSKVNFPVCDIVIEPTKIQDFGIFNFKAGKEMYDIGYEAAMGRMEEIKNLIKAWDR